MELRTNQDLAHFASSALLAWEKCAAQIDALRLFYGARHSEAKRAAGAQKRIAVTMGQRELEILRRLNERVREK